ncbi:endo alpha-1,4 polygalactosaminidase [Marinomonas ostreistagni]|uniref:endo alpha-1,4 polygalactosaminidase n=1 Tax=Marinomonas ostreistagni TaxID=359209 RepID=UPI001EF21365|nr:endo alpha-1,4 polygalactosaminidase [Marinomonas ostreistagni]
MIRSLLLSMTLVATGAGAAPTWYQPSVGTTWQWQLQGELNTGYDVEVYDVDLFDTSTQQIQSLQQQGRKVICYFSAGSLEDWRTDIKAIPTSAIGKPLDGWAGERWLDIRDKQVWRTMQNRLKLAAQKGCNGVEPDNVDGYQNTTGFALSADDQITYNRFLAQSAHILKLSIGLKNSLGLVPELVDEFDFAVNEQCLEYQECDALKPFIEQGKAVFHAEYQLRSNLCQAARSMGFSTLRLPIELDDSLRQTCP